MLQYARSDTHYLLSIYDHLRRALHGKGRADADSPTPLEEVYQRSISVSSIIFSLPPFDHETGHFDSGFLLPLAKHGVLKAYATALAIPTLPLKTGWGPSEARFEVLREVMRWRERVARDEDESGRYVLSLQGTLQLAEVGAAGGVKDANDVIRVLGGTRGGVSEIVRRNKDELAQLVRDTVERVAGSLAGAGGDADMMDASGASSMADLAVSSAQLGLPAAEPAVRPISGLWNEVEAPVASTSSLTTVVSVSVAAASAFFGGGAKPDTAKKLTTPSVALAASSTFFGTGAKPAAKANSAKKGKSREAAAGALAGRAEAVKRVHDSLVLGGGLGQVRSSRMWPAQRAREPALTLFPIAHVQSLQPKAVSAQAVQTDAQIDTDVVLPDAAAVPDPDHGEPAALSADHTYVPLSGRIPKQPAPSTLASSTSHVAPKPKDSDVIVVSSLKDKPKKRRRQGSEADASAAAATGLLSPSEKKPKAKKVKADSGEATAPAKKEKKAKRSADSAPIVPHDYSTSTSILDANPDATPAAIADKKERKKQEKIDRQANGKKKGFEIDLSDFRRAPRVANAPKKANVSRSFAK